MTLNEYFADKKRGAKSDMARNLGISRTWMALINSGLVVPSPSLAVEIEKATGGLVKRMTLRPDIFGE